MSKKINKSFEFNEGVENSNLTDAQKKAVDEVLAESSLVWGIDLGTTNSVISYMAGKNRDIAEVVTFKGNDFIVPSCVMWLGEDNFLVGREAYEKRYLENVAYSTKRLMGTNSLIPLSYEGETIRMTPQQIASKVLLELKNRTEAKFGVGLVKDVVITVPAYFNDKQRKATKEAGELIGLNILKIINEPTSAALAYGLDKLEGKHNLFVYDLGGGTFDISAVICTNIKADSSAFAVYGIGELGSNENQQYLEVVASDGDVKLGGDDFDEEMLKIFCSKVDEAVRENFGKPKYKYFSKLSKVDKKKLILSLENYKKLNVGELGRKVQTEYGELEVTFGKSDLNAAADIIFDRTKVVMDRILSDEKMRDFDLNKVVLVGGSTRSERVRQRLSEYFKVKTGKDIELYLYLDPDKSVSLGAAVQGSILANKDSKIAIMDVNPIPIGVRTEGGRFDTLIKQNALLPVSYISEYETVTDNQQEIVVEVYQGKSLFVENNVKLGDLLVDNLPEGKAGEVRIRVTLMLDLNGILKIKVNVKDKEYFKELSNIYGSTEEKVEATSRQDKMFARWRVLAKEDEQLATLLEENADPKEVMKYLQNKRANDNETAKLKSDLEKENAIAGSSGAELD